ncbi:hypothetical protein G6F42_016172 [Rhizopus arrhizus]|nr:hypothetical protein G6F42_016172 [Rhizopus arrhizus]
MSQNAFSSNVQAAIDSAVGSKAIDVYAYLEGSKKPVIEEVVEDLNLNKSASVEEQSETVNDPAPASIDLQDTSNTAVENVVGSSDETNSTEAQKEIVESVPEVAAVPAAADEEVVEAKSDLVDEIKETVPEVEATAVDETKEEAVEAKEDVVEEIKQTVAEVAPVPAVAESKPVSVDLAAAVNYAVDSVVGSPAVDVYSYLEKTNKPTLVEKVEQGVQKVKEEVSEVKNEVVEEVKEKSREIKPTPEPEQPAVEAKEELVEEIKETVPEVPPAAVDETKEEAVEAKEDVLEEIKESVPQVAPVAVATETKQEPLQIDLQSAVDYAVKSVVGYGAVDVYAYLEKTNPTAVKKEATATTAVQDLGAQAQQLTETVRSAVVDDKKQAATVSDVKTDALNLAESAKIAAVATVSAATAGAASLLPSTKSSPNQDENDVKRDIDTTTETETKPFVQNAKDTVVENATAAKATADATIEEAKEQAPVIQKEIDTKVEAVKAPVVETIQEAKEQAPVIQKDIDNKVESAKAAVNATVEEAKEQAPVIQKSVDDKVDAVKKEIPAVQEQIKNTVAGSSPSQPYSS